MNKYKINPDLTYKKISDQIFILDEVRAEVRELNETASFIFLRLLNWTNSEEIAQTLVEEYNISKKEALQDTKEFVSMYIKKGYIIQKLKKGS